MISPNLRVLLVEDDDIDAEAVKRGFAKAGVACPLYRATNGIQALAMLRKKDGDFQNVPYVVLLDLKLPQMNGPEFLAAIRADEELRKSVVFVLTTSNDPKDKLTAYSHCVAGYITKSNAGVEFRNLIQLLGTYAEINEFPICA
ncbi:two-component system response regulator [Blastopirellula marina]|uniref:Two-component system response regulator n=1 Tax=Blastopirellula marina TaxID=124 RepID=A0A2S8G8N9_9BACT|nr:MULTISPECIES: response regulator [Pirellulaceae]PQO40793.1 two-component system response regulator [Blastopirellula marina]RCS56120.1 response regulator [Bremerella cremea]